MNLNPKIAIVGTFKTLSSISIINNRLYSYLFSHGFNICQLESLSKISDINNIDMVITHNWPPFFNLKRFAKCKKCIILPWEYEFIPNDWIEPLNTVFDEIWVPSNFTYKALINSGIETNIKVIPNGFEPNVFNNAGKKISCNICSTEKKIRFLFVGGTIWRKGIDILLEAYTSTFSNRDDVVLIIKDFGNKSFYLNQNFKEKIHRISANKHSPEIIYIDRDLSMNELSMLYRFATCLVHPYRGEGFGMPVLEALACGKPVIVTKGGATDDFCKKEFAYMIESVKIRHRLKGLNLVKERVDIITPKLNSLRFLMYNVYSSLNDAEERGKTGYAFVHKNFTWGKVLDRYIERINFYF